MEYKELFNLVTQTNAIFSFVDLLDIKFSTLHNSCSFHVLNQIIQLEHLLLSFGTLLLLLRGEGLIMETFRHQMRFRGAI